MDGEAIIEFAFNSLSRLCTLKSILSACVLRILQKFDGVRLQRPEMFPLSIKTSRVHMRHARVIKKLLNMCFIFIEQHHNTELLFNQHKAT